MAGISATSGTMCKRRGMSVVADVHVHPGGQVKAIPTAITR